MKAKINITLDDNNNYNHSVDGNPIELATLLHAFASTSKRNKASLLIACQAVLRDEGKERTSGVVMDKALEILESNDD